MAGEEKSDVPVMDPVNFEVFLYGQIGSIGKEVMFAHLEAQYAIRLEYGSNEPPRPLPKIPVWAMEGAGADYPVFNPDLSVEDQVARAICSYQRARQYVKDVDRQLNHIKTIYPYNIKMFEAGEERIPQAKRVLKRVGLSLQNNFKETRLSLDSLLDLPMTD